MVYYLSYFSSLDPISLSPLLPSRSLFLSVCLYVHSHKAAPFNMDIVFYELWLEKSPITAALCRCTIDGFPNGCRWAQGAIGTEPWSAALF